GEKKELPQSKIGSEEPIFASPLLKSGGRGGFAAGRPQGSPLRGHITPNYNLSNRHWRYGWLRRIALWGWGVKNSSCSFGRNLL
ncbi:MAG: hypothetical protein IKC09_09560, partial [Oscillospiraceae bacterium]|nr:hypothetical protein [Oscillospiraceae bacterium]